MAEKEERILINIEQSNYNGVFGFGAGATVWQCTKAEAIETMAKAIFEKDNVLALDIRFEELAESKRNFYYSVAKAALNALLGVEK